MRIETNYSMTPSKAKQLLADTEAAGFTNRTLSQKWVRELAGMITRGCWDAHNAEAIKVDKSGAVIDGQHRLHAIIRAGKAVRVTLATALKRSSFLTLGDQRIRQASQLLQSLNLSPKNKAMLASAARGFLTYKRRTTQAIGPIIRGDNVTKAETCALAEQDTLLQDIVCEVASLFKRCLPAPSVIGLAWRIACNHHQEEAAVFFQAVADGVGLRPSDPAYALRERLLAMQAAKRSGCARGREEVLYLCLAAFKAHLAGKSLAKMMVPTGTLELPKFRVTA